jgi:hypothetical protein
MAGSQIAVARGRWTAVDRISIVLMLVAITLGTPGLGFETRTVGNDALASVVFGLLIIPPIAALVLSWRMPRASAWLGAISGALFAAVAVVDLLGLMIGPPPAGMVLVDALILVTGLFVVARCWRLVRA